MGYNSKISGSLQLMELSDLYTIQMTAVSLREKITKNILRGLAFDVRNENVCFTACFTFILYVSGSFVAGIKEKRILQTCWSEDYSSSEDDAGTYGNE